MKVRSVFYRLSVVLLALSACGGGATGAWSPAVSGSNSGLSSAATRSTGAETSVIPDSQRVEYCREVNGTPQSRQAEYNTNGGPALPLANYETFCRFTSTSDGSRIYINAYSLYTTQPTLAVLAYLAKVPNGSCEGNPASCYCTLLGGSDQFGGTTGAGGGWVYKTSVDQVLEACIFPDMSSIDSWGLLYHANNIIRGIDLSTVVRYKPPAKKR